MIINTRKILILASAAMFSWGLLNAQEKAKDEIILMSGKILQCEIMEIGEEEIAFKQHRKGDKFKERFVDKYRVFAIKSPDGTEKIIYEQDTTIGNFYDIEEMRMFIYGEQDAIRNYKTPVTTTVGILVGIAGGYLMGKNFFVFTVPFAFTVLAGIPRINIKPESVSNNEYMNHESYVLGYERTAKSKRIQNALKGSIIGLVAGIAILYTTNPD